MKNVPVIINYQVIFLWIYMPIHRTGSFIVNVADPEYTKEITFELSWWMMLYRSIYLYIFKKTEIEVKFQSIIIGNQTATCKFTDRKNS